MRILPIISFNKHNNNEVSFARNRVDKGLERFSEFNKDKMPVTMASYLETLQDKRDMSPLQAQRNAFALLSIADTVDDIKGVYPNEPLFKDLRTVQDTTSTNGILWHMKKLKPVMNELGIAPLKSKEDFTVYLVKKVFLEAKALGEINEDLDNDLDELFKSEIKSKSPEVYAKKHYITPNTIKALGIKFPETSYLNSLKFTRPGYADEFGELSSMALRLYYDSLSQEQRDALARKSTGRLENWWNSLSENQKLELLAQDENTLKMQAQFEEFKRQNPEVTTTTPKSEEKKNPTEQKTYHAKVGSETFAKDELFKRWAANKLAIYENNLSDDEKLKLNIKRARNAAQRWEQMSPAEKTEYIAKLKAGVEPLRYTMIDAWNNSFGLLVDLSDFLSEKHSQRSADEVYSKEELSKYMSEIMTEFWSTHVVEAKQFGQEIQNSWKRVELAIANGRFEQLKTAIADKRKIREFDLHRYKKLKAQSLEKPEQPNAPVVKPPKQPETKTTTNPIKEKATPTVPTENTDTVKIKTDRKFDGFGFELLTEFFKSSSKAQEDLVPELKNMTSTQKDEFFKDVPEQYKEDFNRIHRIRTYALIYVMNEFISKNSINGADGSYLNHIMEFLPTLKENTKKIRYADNGKLYTITLTKGVNGKKIVEQFKEMLEPLTEQEIRQIMKKYFPKEINGEPANMSDDAREKVCSYLKKFGIKYLTKVFSENPPRKYDMYKTHYDTFKASMKEYAGVEIEGLMDNKDYTRICKNKAALLKTLSSHFPYLPHDFLNTYLSVGLSSMAVSGNAFRTFVKYNTTNTVGAHSAETYCVPKEYATLEEKVKLLAMEKILADILYLNTKDKTVYDMEFEDLCNMTHFGLFTKKFPSTQIFHSSSLNKDIEFTFNRRINNGNFIEKKYKDCLKECDDWLKNVQTNPDISLEDKLQDLVYILNPDEKKANLDEAVKNRIEKYNIADNL